MHTFMRHYADASPTVALAAESHAPARPADRYTNEMANLIRVVCDEEALDCGP